MVHHNRQDSAKIGDETAPLSGGATVTSNRLPERVLLRTRAD